MAYLSGIVDIKVPSKTAVEAGENPYTRPSDTVRVWPDRSACQTIDLMSNAAGLDLLPMPLRLLVMQEPKDVASRVGTTLLKELMALHPDAFAPFPALRAV